MFAPNYQFFKGNKSLQLINIFPKGLIVNNSLTFSGRLLGYDIDRFIAVIPARAGSKGIKNKNTRIVGGKKVYEYAIETARSVGIKNIVLTTDIPEILQKDHGSDVHLYHRPMSLSGDDVPMDAVLEDIFVNALDAAVVVVLLQPTSPLRAPTDVIQSFHLYDEGDADLVLTVSEVSLDTLKCGTIEGRKFIPLRNMSDLFSNRQSLPKLYKPNGAVFVFESSWFLEFGGFRPRSIDTVIMPLDRSVDLDTESDLLRFQSIVSSFNIGDTNENI